MTTATQKRITLATIKRFIRNNAGRVLIQSRSSFDSMTDCNRSIRDRTFAPAVTPAEGRNFENCLGIQGAWFVLGGGDFLSAYETETHLGYQVSNCCESFILAVAKPVEVDVVKNNRLMFGESTGEFDAEAWSVLVD